jgi:hypothetical protein
VWNVIFVSPRLANCWDRTVQACVMLNAILGIGAFSLLSVFEDWRLHLGPKSNNELNESRLKAEHDIDEFLNVSRRQG